MKIKILLIDDNSDSAGLFKKILNRDRFLITGLFPSAEPALKFLKKNEADIIILGGIKTSGKISLISAINSLSGIDIPLVLNGFENITDDDNEYDKSRVYGQIIGPLNREQLSAILELAVTRHSTEKKLREMGEKYKLLADNSSDIIWTMDFNGKFTYISPSSEQTTGLLPEQIMKIPVFECVTKESADLIKKTLYSEIKKPPGQRIKSKTLELKHYRKDFSTIDVEIKTTWLYDKKGKIIGIQGNARDITERKRFEESLKKSEELYRILADNVSDVLWILDMNLIFTYSSPSVKKYLGYIPEEIIGKHVTAITPIESVQETAVILSRELAMDGKPGVDPKRTKTIIAKNIHKDGSIKWAEFNAAFLRDENGRPVGILGVTRDITDRKKAEDKILISNSHMELLNELNFDFNKGIDLDSIIKKSCDRLKAIHNFRYSIFWLLYRQDGGDDYFMLKYANVDNRIFNLAQKLIKFNPYQYKIKLFKGSIYRKFYDNKKPLEINNNKDTVNLVSDLLPPEKKALRKIIKKISQKELYKNIYIVPVINREKPIGHFGFNKELPFETHEKDAINIIIDKIAALIERKTTEEDLIRAKEKAELASRAKSDFLARMSHEIRTPMNAIIGMTDLALMTTSEKERLDYLITVEDSAYHLLNIINDVLDYSIIEADKLPLKTDIFDLYETVSSLVKALWIQSAKKGVPLDLKMNKRLRRCYMGDEGKLRQVLINIISNSIKFTHKGEIKVAVEERNKNKKPGNSSTILFTIKDTGIGIPEEYLAEIFESFSQVDNSYVRKHGGAGLGLAISKKLVELMGGDLNVKSRVNKGSEFSFFIDLKEHNRPMKKKRLNRKKTEARPGKKSLKILMAEDNAVNARLLTVLLNKLGHSTKTACDGIEAIEILTKEKFHLVFMDIEMPNMDGLEAARLIRAGEAGKGNIKIPIIAITAHAQPHIKMECLSGGIDDYISKPINIHSISDCIRKIFIN